MMPSKHCLFTYAFLTAFTLISPEVKGIDFEKEININEVSSRLSLSMSATSRLIDDLVKKELIERIENSENRGL